MAQDWDRLLRALGVTDVQVYDTVAHACRKRYGRRATPELCQAVLNTVFIRLAEALRDRPDGPLFATGPAFLGAVFTTAWRAHGPDIRDRHPNAVGYLAPYRLPAAAVPPEDEDAREWGRLRELIGDCDRAVRECLAAAPADAREVFRLRCLGVKPDDIRARLGLSETTLCRRWKVAAAHFVRTCGRAGEVDGR